MKLISKSSEGLHGEIKIPGDKSISHRALICAAISDGTSKISNLQESEDGINTLKSLKQLGISIVKENESYYIEGKGFRGLKESENQLYFGNSGTGIRLMSGLLSIQNFSSSLSGDKSLDFNYYSKRFILMNVYLFSYNFWLKDESNNLGDTKIFVEKQISNVLKFGALKKKIKNFFS